MPPDRRGFFSPAALEADMRRRRFLAAVLGAATVGIAGCNQAEGDDGTTTEAVTPTPDPIQGQVGSVDLPVPREELRTALPRDEIPAIVDPAFDEDWTGLDGPDAPDSDPLLPADSPVIGVERDGRARAYPLRILDWHEAVNDTFGGPLLVTYCPLCGSAVVAERRVDGEETVFGVSGLLWREDLVLYDRATDSLWSQLLATAIRGPRTGEGLSLLPSSLTTWGEWQESNPDTEVLLPPPWSNTVRGPDQTFDYADSKYFRDDDQLIGYGAGGDGELAPKAMVLGVSADGEARAYPFDVVKERDVIHDTVGSTPVVVAFAPGDTMVAYDRRVDGSRSRFEPDGDRHLRAGGSRWERTTGRAVDGPYEGRTLPPATDSPPMFWKGWSNFHPDTSVYPESE